VQLFYASGETVRKGDRIRYADGDGIVEFVADPQIADPETAHYAEEFGGGCMILTERVGRVFVEAPHEDEDLQFVSRQV
jgi:hypothetical protein